MILLFLLILSLLLPLLPWIGLASPLIANKNTGLLLPGLAGSGIILDLWWGKSLGGASLVLLVLVAVTKIVSKFWPTERRSLAITSGVFSLAVMEIYLYLA